MKNSKIHTTNYNNTFIAVADDCPTNVAQIPPIKLDNKTIANLQFELVAHNPYKYTSDEVIFQVFATKKNLSSSQFQEERELFFSKGQACFRCSPLTKRYGWGLHNDENGKMALYPIESDEYNKFKNDKNLTIVKAMRSSKAK